MSRAVRIAVAAAVVFMPMTARADEPAWRGFIEMEASSFPRSSVNPSAATLEQAVKFRPEVLWKANERWSFGMHGFARQDSRNAERDTARFDELWVQYAERAWDVRVGEQVITWGSVESFSPLDVVNPRDNLEDVVEPAKIGTPAARLRLRSDDDDLSFYWLPVYQPARYPGTHSYYGSTGAVPAAGPSGGWAGNQAAARWFHSGDGYDVGLSVLDAFERNPKYDYDATSQAFAGRRYRSRRVGFEATRVIDELLLKSEIVARTTHEEGNRRALLYVLGAEYTLTSVWRYADLTAFAEYLGASSNVRATELMQNDVFVALRLTFNDRLKQRLQVGTFRDLDHASGHLDRIEYTASPVPGLEAGLRRTTTRDYFPGVVHRETDTSVWRLFVRYNF